MTVTIDARKAAESLDVDLLELAAMLRYAAGVVKRPGGVFYGVRFDDVSNLLAAAEACESAWDEDNPETEDSQ